MSSWATLFFRNTHLLGLACLLALTAGVSALLSLPRLEDPVITNRNPLILVPYPGATADRVESQILQPLEIALQEIPRIKKVESNARTGLGLLAIELDDSVDQTSNGRIFSEIRDKVGGVPLPVGAGPLQFDEQRRAIATSLLIGLSWEKESVGSPAVLARAAEELAERLRAVPQTELVRVQGAPKEEILVQIDGAALTNTGLQIGQISEALARADAKTPAGIVRSETTDRPLELSGELDSVRRISAVPILEERGGAGLRVGDIATVRRSAIEPPESMGLSEGRPTVWVAARVEQTARIDQWARAAHAVVADFSAAYPSPLRVDVAFDQSEYTSERLGELWFNLLLAVVIVWGVVFVLMGWKAAWIVAAAIPLTAGLTLFAVASGGGALHQMSIFGMIVALGILVDNAIVVTDEVRQHLLDGMAGLEAVSRSVRHLAIPLLASTITTILSFLPIMLLPGNAGDFVGSIGQSVVIGLAMSLLVALTLTAALAGHFGKPSARESHSASWVARGVQWPRLAGWCMSLLRLAVERPLWGLASSAVLPLLGFALAGTLGSQFFPRTDRDMFEIRLWLPAGTSLAETRRIVNQVEKSLRRTKEVLRIDWSIGQSHPPVYYNQLNNQDGLPHFAQGAVRAASAQAVARWVPELQQSLSEQFPQAQILVGKFAQGPPAPADIEFRLVGPSLATLRELGQVVRRTLAEHPEVLLTRASLAGGEPKWKAVWNEDAAGRAGIGPVEGAEMISSRLDGLLAGTLVEETERLPIRVRLGEAERQGAQSLRRISLLGSDPTTPIPFAALADLEIVPELPAITRKQNRRVNLIHGFCHPDSLPIEVVRDVQKKLQESGFELPAGYRLELGGEAENQAEALGNLSLYLPLLALATLATLVLAFRSFALAALLLVVALLSAGYGLLATWAWNLPISFNTILGTLGLMGLAFNSSIVVLAAILADPQARSGDPQSISLAVQKTGRHLVATTLTTIGSFLPILFLIGGQFWPPLAVVLAGGVGGSTLLAWTFIPAAFRLISRKISFSQNALKDTGPDPPCGVRQSPA